MKTPQSNQPNPAENRRKPAGKVRGLHKYVATGGTPAEYESCQGVDSTTVPGYKGRK